MHSTVQKRTPAMTETVKYQQEFAADTICQPPQETVGWLNSVGFHTQVPTAWLVRLVSVAEHLYCLDL